MDVPADKQRFLHASSSRLPPTAGPVHPVTPLVSGGPDLLTKDVGANLPNGSGAGHTLIHDDGHVSI